MRRADPLLRRPAGWWAVGLVSWWLWVLAGPAGISQAAQTQDPVAMRTTQVVVRMDAEQPLAIQAAFLEQPPAVLLTFPGQRVLAALPERSMIAKGPIQAILAHYKTRPTSDVRAPRALTALRIALTGPYAHRVRSEPGRIIVDIEHPTSISRAAVEIGLGTGTVISGLGMEQVSQRFRAMQAALAQAQPIAAPQAPPTTAEPRHDATSAFTAPVGDRLALTWSPEAERGPSAPSAAQEPREAEASRAGRRGAGAVAAGLLALLGLAAIGAAMLWRRRPLRVGAGRPWSGRAEAWLPSSATLVSQLVCGAFERQGWRLVKETELGPPMAGTLRVIEKDDAQATLLFVGSARFFEKQAVERFLEAMRQAHVPQGFLVASGAFTVPAQQLAKAHRVTLIGRDQLIELLGAGAQSEYMTTQLEQAQARSQALKEALERSAADLDTLRRQRNEASWFLGEERARSAALEARLEEVTRELRQQEAEAARWEQDATAMRRRWEESEWYLGESRERLRYLERQLATLQEAARHIEPAQRERDEATWFLGEERARHEATRAQLAQLQQELDAAAQRERGLRQALDRLMQELNALRASTERRRHARATVESVAAELSLGDTLLVSPQVRDISRAGLGLETEGDVPLPLTVPLRLTLPGLAPQVANARRRWQRSDGQPPRCRSGFRVMGLSAATRRRIDELVQQAPPSNGP
jgi:hypothetical protein